MDPAIKRETGMHRDFSFFILEMDCLFSSIQNRKMKTNKKWKEWKIHDTHDVYYNGNLCRQLLNIFEHIWRRPSSSSWPDAEIWQDTHHPIQRQTTKSCITQRMKSYSEKRGFSNVNSNNKTTKKVFILFPSSHPLICLFVSWASHSLPKKFLSTTSGLPIFARYNKQTNSRSTFFLVCLFLLFFDSTTQRRNIVHYSLFAFAVG